MPYRSEWTEESLSKDQVEALPGITLVEFGADWCPHCRAVQSVLEELLSEREIRHIKVADGKGKPLGRGFGVKLWPNFILLEDGEVREQLARPSESQLRQMLTPRS